MICISSPAGVRMAKAYAEMMDAGLITRVDTEETTDDRKLVIEYLDSARQVAEELKQNRFHEMTGP